MALAADTAFLVVDDEAIILHSLKSELRSRYGRRFRIETGLSAEEGLVIIEELATEGINVILVISDWLMPGMKGDEFLMKVKREHPRMIAIMITGQADEDAIKRALAEGGVAACFRKPWISADLHATIERELSAVGLNG